jgi:2-phospho-L-lactate/phosphoenolpyruvate guanylyltransferase
MSPDDGGGADRPPTRGVTGDVQATVLFHDRLARTGSVVLDDGTEIAYGASAFDPSGLRLLRPGQRVRLRLDVGGAVSFLTIVTLPDGPSAPSGQTGPASR